MTKSKRGPGRPPSGKKAFCIRMRPETHDQLFKAAKQDGFNCLGDVFDAMVAGPGAGDGRPNDKQ